MGPPFPKTEATPVRGELRAVIRLHTLSRIIAPWDKQVIYSALFNLQTHVCQQSHMSATGRVSTTK
jgi:hypothetical protein